ncbi:MAG: ATP synthase F1 subunit epsilon [Candidatus Pelagibacter sp. TMED165]|nr:MAG: ATP synthase F1 subunit epsilon [Candidatus Pelagibacter sp. TMED165]|tara:strand:+ start:183 stop:569 length:387 start_codon:yes stop_codon:yes gene_type:complete
MSENFNIQIISPDKTILNLETEEVIIPSYEGQMTILKDHIPIITFLRPGFIEIKSKGQKKKFFIEEGTVEFLGNNLLILSSTIKSLSDISQSEKQNMIQASEKKLLENISDKEKYEIAHKIDSLKEIN